MCEPLFTLDDDVRAKLEQEMRRNGKTFKDLVNHYLRLGLNARQAVKPARRFVVRARPMGLREGLSRRASRSYWNNWKVHSIDDPGGRQPAPLRLRLVRPTAPSGAALVGRRIFRSRAGLAPWNSILASCGSQRIRWRGSILSPFRKLWPLSTSGYRSRMSPSPHRVSATGPS